MIIPLLLAEALTTSAPNTTVHTVSLSSLNTANASSGNVNLALVPLNGGSILAAIPNDSTVGGAIRGTSAVDLQLVRDAASQVAAGNNSFIVGLYNTIASTGIGSAAIGHRNTVSGAYAAALGRDNTVTGQYGMALGYKNTVSGQGSAAIGYQTTDNGLIGKISVGNSVSVVGANQGGILVLSGRTTNASTKVLTSDQGARTANNHLVLANNSSVAFFGIVVARQASTSTNTASWLIQGTAKKLTSNGTIVLEGGTITPISNVPVWGLAFATDTTLGSVLIQFTGAIATNIAITATLFLSEAFY